MNYNFSSVQLMQMILIALIVTLTWTPSGFAETPKSLVPTQKTVQTNSVRSTNSPSWLTEGQVERATDKIQNFMEWDIRKVDVSWYYDQAEFQKFHGYDQTVVAISKKDLNSIHLGPRVTSSNFGHIFGHELVHIILFQKYKKSIPQWLEEGLANFVSKHDRVNYSELAKWLALPEQAQFDAKSLGHPYLEKIDPHFHYQASTGLAEMLDSKCRGLRDLLQLSVQTGLEGYLATYCEIVDLNSEFKKWVNKKDSLNAGQKK